MDLKKIVKHNFNRASVKALPEYPGVYLFWSNKKITYIGKAINLRKRVASYLTNDLSPKTQKMIMRVTDLSIIPVNSELESLLLESSLIRKFQPFYNFVSKDDKHPLYIKITKDRYPRVITARKPDLKESSSSFGPFPSSKTVYFVLKMIRKIFPYSSHKLGKRACFYSHLGQCRPCPNEIEKRKNEKDIKLLRSQYLKNIRMIKKTLQGKFEGVNRDLNKKMKILAHAEKFEEALLVKEQIEKINYITQPITPKEYFLENPNLRIDLIESQLEDLAKVIKPYFSQKIILKRIESYDVAHMGGSYPAASLVTFVDGEPEKRYYRHFRIHQKKGFDDLSSLRETALRREKYLESWGKPDLIIVDGGKGQVGVFYKIFSKYQIPVIGISKYYPSLIIRSREGNFVSFQLRNSPAKQLVERIRNEAHRFAQRYHHHLISLQYKQLF